MDNQQSPFINHNNQQVPPRPQSSSIGQVQNNTSQQQQSTPTQVNNKHTDTPMNNQNISQQVQGINNQQTQQAQHVQFGSNQAQPTMNNQQVPPIMNRNQAQPTMNNYQAPPNMNSQQVPPAIGNHQTSPIMGSQQQQPTMNNQQASPAMNNQQSVYVNQQQSQSFNMPSNMQQSADYRDGQGVQQENDVKNDKKKLGKNKVLLFIVGGALLFVLLFGIVLTVVPKQEKVDPLDASDLEFETEPFEYTYDEIVELRRAGYTGDEIENYELQMFDAQDLIKQAEDERQAIYESEIAPYYDEASDEVKALYANSWCGQEELEVVGTVDDYKYMTSTINVDYEKIPATGYQCFIKVYIHEDKPAFMTVTPDRYLSLNQTGNIVLQVDYIIMPNGSRCITQMKEIVP